MKNKIYDIIIVGGGPAGLTAAIYGARANMNVLILHKENVGSLISAHKIDNYPGFPEGLKGKELNNLMKEQALKYGAEIINATLLDIDVYSTPKIIKTDKDNFLAKTIIIATGWSKNNSKKIKGEEEFLGKGVSYCATCDGAFTKNLDVTLFGQGEEIAEEALFLTKYSKTIKIFVNEKELKCHKKTYDALINNEKVEIITNSELIKITGNDFVEKVIVKINNEEKEIKADYAFLYLGTKSSLELFSTFANVDQNGYIITKDDMKTNIEGIYAAGDVREKSLRQVTTAVSDGTIAATEAIKYILKQKKKEA
ncbi:thioredoxin reductase (NADPH) [Hypnocyclicus thermotrophus]|uniref:Thioredoxin reductase (NADPH) n=1 Tax=Hypnocyclicus thermotrophus TaxID=1627895 RepID=A0AA46I5Y0_9FUSO|nr:FAD-dependent oxidoreductase [Hypnocyclicus thermotrophus]TDT71832.1 thioredoxin reductase (NADPH) [Hypnocyclicus thermotrophus]